MTLSVSSPTTYESATSTYNVITMLSATKALVCYRDGGNGGRGTACVLTLSGSTVSAGTPVVFESTNVTVNLFSVVALSETKAVVLCHSSTMGQAARVLDISGTTITPGASRYAYANCSRCSAVALSDTQVLISYNDNSNSSYGTARILTISGTSITAETAYVYESDDTAYISVTALSSTKAVTCYSDVANSSQGTACVLDISGTTITPGTPVVFETDDVVYTTITKLSESVAVVCYGRSTGTSAGVACVLDISGSTITPGSSADYSSSGAAWYNSAGTLSSTRALVAYRDSGNGNRGTCAEITVAGSVPTIADTEIFDTSDCAHIGLAALTSIEAIVCFTDNGSSSYGKAIVATASAQGGAVTSTQASQTASISTTLTTFDAISTQGNQTAAIVATNTRPANYGLAIQLSQRANVVAQKTGANNFHYFSTAGLTTTPTSTPANEVIPPTLKNPGNIYREINLNNFGIVKPSFGEIVISNLDGSHDDLLTKKIDGQKVTLYRGKRSADFPSGFTQVMTTTAAGIAADYNQIRVKLRDSLALLETPVLKRQFAGTGGIEGDASVANESKQRHFLCSTYIPPKLIHAQKLIYILSDNNAAESSGNKWRVYDGGVEIERSADYASLSEIDIVAPAAGKCRLFINQDGGVYLRLGSTPAYDVRVLPTWVTSSSVPDSGYFAQEIIEEIGGITVDDTGPVVEGRIVLDNDETVSDFLSDFCKSQAYNIWTNQLNAVQIQRFRYIPGAVTSSYDFTQNEIISIKVENIIPAWKITLNCGQAFPSSLASGADDTIKADLSKQDYMKSVSVEDITVKSAHKLASSLSIDTKAFVTDDATMLSVFQAIFSADRQVISMDVVVSDETLTLDLNDVVTLTMPRFNLNSGKNFVVVGIRTDFALNRLNLTLWG